MQICVLREGRCGGDEYAIKCAKVFATKALAEKHLQAKGFKKEKQPYGDPLWISPDGCDYAEPLLLDVIGERKKRVRPSEGNKVTA